MRTLIYDFETSGLNPYHEDVIEIGCKCIETGEFYQCYVKPLSRLAISDDITKITGITNDILKKKGLRAITAYTQFMDFIRYNYDVDNDIMLIAHNGTLFDDIFLKRMYRYLQEKDITIYDEMMDNIQFVDSLMVARLLYPKRYSHSMHNMCKMFNVKNKAAHRAMGDVDGLIDVWNYMIIEMKGKQIDISGTNLRYITCC